MRKRTYLVETDGKTKEIPELGPGVYPSGSRSYILPANLEEMASNSAQGYPIERGTINEGNTENTRSQDDEKSPLSFCKFIVRYPWHAFALTLLGHLFMLGMTLILIFMKMDVFPTEFKQIPFQLNGQDSLLENWGWTYRNRNTSEVFPRVTTSVPHWERGINTDPLQVIYIPRQHGDNLLTKHILQQIKDMEDWLSSFESYTENICQLSKERECMNVTSILRYFDGSMVDISPVFNDPHFDNVVGVVWEASTNPQTKNSFNYFLGNKSLIQMGHAYADYLRSSFPVGYPIHGIDQSWSSYVGQIAFAEISPAITAMQPELAPSLIVSPISWNMFVSGAGEYGIHDIMLVLGSVIFIFIFVWFQTGSLWLTFFAVFSIITSFLGTNLIYRYVFDFRYFGYFHLIAMFIILGIGADDIFVFVNTWKQSAFEPHSSLEHRMSAVYRRASVSMFVTSFTTMVAFYVTSLSPLLAARSFGLFTGSLIIVNYVSVVVFFPCVVIVYHKCFESINIMGSVYRKISLMCCKSKVEGNSGGSGNEREKKPSIMVTFFEGRYFEVLSHQSIRWLLVSLFAIIFIFFSWSASSLKPDSEQVMIFKDTTVLGRGWKLSFGAFKPTAGTLLNNRIVWGAMPRNTSECHFSDYHCVGQPQWDEAFDLNQPDVQIAMRDFCQKIKYDLSEEQLNSLSIGRNAKNETHVHCFMEDMGKFLEREAKRLNKKAGRHIDLSFPLTEKKVRPFMEIYSLPSCDCSCFYDLRKLPPTFHRYFEVMLSYWLTFGYTLIETDDYRKYGGMLGEGPDGDNTHVIELYTNNTNCSIGDFGNLVDKLNRSNIPLEAVPRYGTKLRYAAIPLNLTLNFFGLGYTQGLPIYYAWQDFLQEELPALPYQLRQAMQANGEQWHWLFVQQTVVRSAILGVALGIGLALPVLILATKNFIVGTLSTLIIAATCTCVIGVIPLCGWKLGLLVSINLCLVVGLSVDYIVHMSEGYHMSHFESRAEKIKDALGKTGISVLSGAVTTLGAAFFMFFGNTQFFLQFASFLFSTIVFSTLFSLGLFPVLMMIIGPQGKTGSLHQLWLTLKCGFTGRKKTDVQCESCRGKGFVPGESEFGEVPVESEMGFSGNGKQFNNYANPCYEQDTTDMYMDVRPGDSSVVTQGACSSLMLNSSYPSPQVPRLNENKTAAFSDVSPVSNVDLFASDQQIQNESVGEACCSSRSNSDLQEPELQSLSENIEDSGYELNSVTPTESDSGGEDSNENVTENHLGDASEP